MLDATQIYGRVQGKKLIVNPTGMLVSAACFQSRPYSEPG
jgi:hypothetical protein